MPRTVFAASCTAASAALAKLSGDEPMIVITLATSDISSSFGLVGRRSLTSQNDIQDPSFARARVLAQQLVELDSDQEDDRGGVGVDHQHQEHGQLPDRGLEVRDRAD